MKLHTVQAVVQVKPFRLGFFLFSFLLKFVCLLVGGEGGAMEEKEVCIKRSMHACVLLNNIIYHDLITPFRLGISPQARTETIGHYLELNSK